MSALAAAASICSSSRRSRAFRRSARDPRGEEGAKELPVLAQMAFYEDREVSAACRSARDRGDPRGGADGVGVNCGRGFADALAVVEKMAALTDVRSARIRTRPAELRDGRFVYEQPVSIWPTWPRAWPTRGRISSAVAAARISAPSRRSRRASADVRWRRDVARRGRLRAGAAEAAVAAPRTRARAASDAPRKAPLIVVELDPPRGMVTDKVVEGAKLLRSAASTSCRWRKTARVDPHGHVGMAYVVRRDAGVEPLVHFTDATEHARPAQRPHGPRRWESSTSSRSRATGRRARGRRHVGLRRQFDRSREIVAALNAGRTIHGVDIGKSTGFTVGVAFNRTSAR